MRIALVANSFPALSETFIYRHAAGLQARGLDVTVVTARRDNDAAMFAAPPGDRFTGPIVPLVLAENVAATTRHVARRLVRGSVRDVALWDAARTRYGTGRRAVRAWLVALSLADFDVVHLEYSGLAIAYADALPLLRGAIFVSCRGTQERIKPIVDPERADRLRALFALVDRVHCVSEDMLRTCASYGLAPTQAFVNHPSVDVGAFTRGTPYAARARGPYQLVTTGRLHWAKGVEYGLLAVRALRDAGHDVQYLVIGGGPEDEALRFAAHDLGIAPHVTFTGRQPAAEVRSALERADLYLSPSVSEGISNAALEAMAMEVPVVSTTAGGMAEAISDGIDGLTVPSRSPEALAKAVAALLDAPARRVQLGRAGRATVAARFSLDRQISTFVAEYNAAVRTRARRS